MLLVAACLAYAGHVRDLGQRLALAWQAQASEGGLLLDGYRARVQAQTVEGVEKNLSGLAYDSARNHLWAVVNDPPELLALGKEGQLIARYPMSGFKDVEAVACLGENLLAVVEERRDALVIIAVPDAPAPIERSGQRTIELGIGGSHNWGVEGMTYDHYGDRLFLVKERVPRRLVELTGLSASIRGERTFEMIDRSEWLGDESVASDLSSVEYDARSGHLVLLSDESKVILEIDSRGRQVGSRSLLAGLGGLWRSVPQAEGIALDDSGTVYLVSEPNLFYVFDPPLPAVSPAVSEAPPVLGANR